MLLLGLLLWSSFAQVRGEPYMCSPHLWEGKKWTLQITHTDQGPDVWESTSEFSVDIIGQRFASRETGVRFGQPYDIFYLYYYPANTLFRVHDGKCRSSAIEGAIKPNCLNMPDQYAVENLNEFLPTYVNGTYCGGVRGVRDGVGYFHSITPYGFNSPVMEQTQGDVDSVPTYRVSNYYNVTSGIKDPTVFTPPLSCIQTQDLATEDFGIHRPESLFF
ncbi:uncharacterized protein [Littorina saxatilis]|uniref:Uncharacterized protein n=1 Tax=Littorina saxatilis TaxID=31220 RepID=A0AAN9BGD4_9CAEN